jgi:CBS-domain-containing membrane protein
MHDKVFSWLFPVQFPMSHMEAIVSAVAAALTIIANAWISHYVLPPEYQVFLAASMGASTILAMVAYRSPMSQPWAILGGHLVAAVIGLVCIFFIKEMVIAAAAAMALTILAQLVLRCLHAPGGGTALLPVLGSEAILAEGFGFVFVVVVNSLVLIIFAIIFNNLHPGRRYPVPPGTDESYTVRVYTQDELEEAVNSVAGDLDIAAEDLDRISQQAMNYLRREKKGEMSCGQANSQP